MARLAGTLLSVVLAVSTLLTGSSFARPRVARRVGKVADAQAAARLIGKRVYVGMGPSMPAAMLRPMMGIAKQRVEQGKAKTAFHWMSTFAPPQVFSEKAKQFVDHVILFTSPANREATQKKWARRVDKKNSLHELSTRLVAGDFGIDTVVVRVSKPNAQGEVSLGPSGDLTMPAIKAALKRGGRVIAEVNPNVPFTHGTNHLKLKSVYAFYEADKNTQLGEFNAGVSNSISKWIGRNIGKVVPKSRTHTIQVGIGSALSDLDVGLKGHRLRAWSEMDTDNWMLPLMKSGALKGGSFSFLLGTKALYDFADKNPKISIGSCNEINNPTTIAKQTRMVAINTALQVDFSGAANAERIGDRLISSPGGQPNFMQGTARAKDGRAVLALRSTNKYGKSTIVPTLQGPETTPAKHVDYVVTEWGATRRMRGLTTKKRAYQLLKVTHPLHRKHLAKDALTAGLISRRQYNRLARSVAQAIEAGPTDLREYVGAQALAAKLITPASYKQIIASIPAGTESLRFAHGEPPALQPPPIK